MQVVRHVTQWLWQVKLPLYEVPGFGLQSSCLWCSVILLCFDFCVSSDILHSVFLWIYHPSLHDAISATNAEIKKWYFTSDYCVCVWLLSVYKTVVLSLSIYLSLSICITAKGKILIKGRVGYFQQEFSDTALHHFAYIFSCHLDLQAKGQKNGAFITSWANSHYNFFFFLKAMYLWCMFLHENNLILTALWFNSPSCPGKSPIDIHWIQHTLNLSTQGSQSLFVIYTELQKQDVVKLHKLEY